MAPKKRLGEMLIEAGMIDETQLKAALGYQRQWGVRIGQALVDLKLVTEGDIVRALAAKYGFDIARLDAVDRGALQQATKLLPRDFAVRNNVLPIASDTATITVAMSDPSNLAVVDEVQFRTGKRVKVCIGGDHEVAEAVNRHYPGEAPVEAIALDLDADDSGGEAVFDPFGGGSKDALEAFFGGGPDAHAHAAPAPHTPASPPAQAAHPPSSLPSAPPAAAQPAAHAAPAPAAQPAPAPQAARGGVAPHPPSASPTRSSLPAQPSPRPPPAAQPKPAAAPRPPAPAPLAHPAAPHPANAALQVPGSPPRPVPPRSTPAPAAARGLALDLEEGARAQPKEARPAPAAPAAKASPPQPEVPRPPAAATLPPGEPVLATDLSAEEQVEGRTSSRELSEKELGILDALERLAGGAHAEPEIVKPAQAMAAVIRLLLRKRIITETEFLDELTKK